MMVDKRPDDEAEFITFETRRRRVRK